MSVSKTLQQEMEADLIAEAEETDADVGVFQLVDMQSSGFVREGTEDQDEPDELRAPHFRSILLDSAYRQKKPKAQGGGWKRVPIRYRYGCESIDPVHQRENGYEDINPVEGRILFRNGTITVVGDGATTGLLKYLRKDSRNETNPDRIPGVRAEYREIFPEKETEDINEAEFEIGRAMNFIEGLIIDKTPGKMKYDEPRLNALGQYFRVAADKPGYMIKGLVSTARINPAKFLREALAFEERTMTDIAHAEKLGIIKIEDTRVMLISVTPAVILHTLSNKLDDKQKYRSLAGFFASPEGQGKYKQFAFELDEAKKRNISN